MTKNMAMTEKMTALALANEGVNVWICGRRP